MTNAKRDNNQIPVILGTSSSDGTTPIPIKADPSTHALLVNDRATGSDLSGDVALRDDNGVTTLLAVSETDGVTPVPIYADSSTGALLTDSS